MNARPVSVQVRHCIRFAADVGRRLFHEDRGQDLIEYGLLTAMVSLSTVLAFGAFAGKMETAYNGWNTASQNAWEPCPPISSGLPCP